MVYNMKSPGITPGDPGKSVKQLYSWVYQLNENLKYMFSHLEQENFSAAFVPSGTDAQALEALKQSIDEMRAENGALGTWNHLALGNCTSAGGDFTPRAMRMGGQAFLSGAVYLKSSLAHGGMTTLLTLPEDCRPRFQYALPIAFVSGITRMDVCPSGALELRNVSGKTITKDMAISIVCGYPI